MSGAQNKVTNPKLLKCRELLRIAVTTLDPSDYAQLMRAYQESDPYSWEFDNALEIVNGMQDLRKKLKAK